MHETLAQLQGSENVSYILYNDERPDGKSDVGSFGHTKGVLAWDSVTKAGFWLLHSWPKFPVIGAVVAPTPDYGQTFLGLSVDSLTLQSIATQMMACQNPQVYDCRILDGTPDELKALANGHWDTHGLDDTHQPGQFTRFDHKTIGGMPFTVFAKNSAWNDDFWNDGVGPAVDDELECETWVRGAMPLTVDRHGVARAIDVKFINMGALGIHVVFPETADHAKHAIGKDPNKALICVGDINRMISQRKRGGGCIVFSNLNLWSAMSKADMIQPMDGQSREEAHAHIQKTHVKPT